MDITKRKAASIAIANLAHRRGKQKAIVALAHSLLVTIYLMLRNHQPYRDLGSDHFERLESARIERRHDRLMQRGYAVTLIPALAP